MNTPFKPINVISLEKCPNCLKDKKNKIYNALIRKWVEVDSLCDCDLLKQQEQKRIQEAKERQMIIDKRNIDVFNSKRLQQFNFNTIKKHEHKEKAFNYAKNFNKDSGKGLFFIGKTGRGKTVLAVCIGKELISKGYTVLYLRMNRFLDRFNDIYKGEMTREKILNEIKLADFIIIDELGRDGNLTDTRKSNFHDVINLIDDEKKCICIIANPEQVMFYEQEPSLEAALSRIKRLCEQVIFKGQDLR